MAHKHQTNASCPTSNNRGKKKSGFTQPPHSDGAARPAEERNEFCFSTAERIVVSRPAGVSFARPRCVGSSTQPKRCRSHTIIAKNLTGFQQVEVSAKSLILRMRVVLTRTMRSVGKRTCLQGPTAASALSPSPRSVRRAYLRPDRGESICLPTPAARCFPAALGALEPRERNVFR